MSKLHDLVHTIIKHLVDAPEQIKINELDSEHSTVIEVAVAKEDVGKIIGRQGRTADAIRTIIYAAAGKDKKRSIIFQIID